MTTQNLTSTELDGIVSKVRKLLALSQSSNEHEAALAAARAQDLLFRYNLEMSTVEGIEHKQPYDRHQLDLGTGKALEWKRDLIWCLCRYNFCKAVSWSGTKAMSIIGQRHNYEAVIGLYEYLTSAFARMVERAFTEYRLAGGTDHHMSYKTSWLAGAVLGVNAQLREQRKANESESAASSALVVTTEAELEAAAEAAFGKTTKHQGSKSKSAAGMMAGYAAGKTIGLHKQVNDGSAKGAKALK